MSRWPAVVLALTVLGAGGCVPGGDRQETPSRRPASPRAATTAPGALPRPAATTTRTHGTAGWNASGEQDGATYDVVVALYGVYRTGRYATLQASVRLAASEPVPPDGFDFISVLERAHPVSTDPQAARVAGDVTLIDPAARKAYLPAVDGQSGCLCPDDVAVIGYRTDAFTVTFAAPPAGSARIDVSIPNVGYFPGVPVYDRPAPAVSETNGVTTEGPDASGGPVTAKVVDIDGGVANLDQSVVQDRDKVTLDADVLFAFNRAELTPKARSRLREAVGILERDAAGRRVRVSGYTDSKGSDAYNLSLSRRRAEAVAGVLRPRLAGTGITLATGGYGQARPVAPNTTYDGDDNPEGRALNRRVEIAYPR